MIILGQLVKENIMDLRKYQGEDKFGMCSYKEKFYNDKIDKIVCYSHLKYLCIIG